MVLSRLGLAGLVSFLAAAPLSESHVLCKGFLPENDLKIPVSVFQKGGLTEAQFNEVLDKVEAYYTPVIAELDATLVVNRDWEDPTVNASANQSGNRYVINMYGGLARHETITPEGFTLVACHEIGHHIGGAPKVSGWWNTWASNEGAADYFATLRCLRAVFPADENAKWAQAHEGEIDSVLKQRCEELYQTQDEEILCMRSGMAGFSGASLFHAMHEEETVPRFDTPDPSEVTETDDNHPATQCRLDTYYQGGLCVHDMSVPLSDSDYTQGTCTEASGHTVGLRPRCWFKP
ncbi:MAG: hypothetical protein AB7G93_15570 [Bdellovibrionales bacterium]